MFRVQVSENANRNLGDIYSYIAKTDSSIKASHVIDRILETASTLTENPHRGA
ncbi:type II toxin-antitoxin system RelE/ParE family toxin [bacterium]|nr:type II toxin-antitoxin system RelE/ParE family toxin [bacterium]